jgi:hypothetical protein
MKRSVVMGSAVLAAAVVMSPVLLRVAARRASSTAVEGMEGCSGSTASRNVIAPSSTGADAAVLDTDGRAANTRANSNGIDINRDHLALVTEESQAVARLVRDYRRQVVHDAHEYGGRDEVYERDLIRARTASGTARTAVRSRRWPATRTSASCATRWVCGTSRDSSSRAG